MLNPNADYLLPCPWCGSKGAYFERSRVVCDQCGATGPANNDIEFWNSGRFIRALLAAIEQRNSLLPSAATSEYEYRKNQQKRAETEGWMDARLLAILEGREG